MYCSLERNIALFLKKVLQESEDDFSRKIKTCYIYINNMVNLFAKKLIQNLHSNSRYGIFYVWYPWFWWQPNILKICTEMVLCLSIPLQIFSLLQAVHMILKYPLNNFFWLTPYWIRNTIGARRLVLSWSEISFIPLGIHAQMLDLVLLHVLFHVPAFLSRVNNTAIQQYNNTTMQQCNNTAIPDYNNTT